MRGYLSPFPSMLSWVVLNQAQGKLLHFTTFQITPKGTCKAKYAAAER